MTGFTNVRVESQFFHSYIELRRVQLIQIFEIFENLKPLQIFSKIFGKYLSCVA